MTHRVEPITIEAMRGAEAEPLLRAHWEEVARHKDIMRLSPAWDKYQLMEQAGTLFALGAFVGPALVGYSLNLIGPHLHYSGLIYAQNDVLYVVPECRKSRIGLDLISETERIARERGAGLMAWHAKEGTALAGLMPRLGYGVQDIIYARKL